MRLYLLQESQYMQIKIFHVGARVLWSTMRKTCFVCQKQSFHELAFSRHKVLELSVQVKDQKITFCSFHLIIHPSIYILREKDYSSMWIKWSGSVVSQKNGKCSIRFKVFKTSKKTWQKSRSKLLYTIHCYFASILLILYLV